MTDVPQWTDEGDITEWAVRYLEPNEYRAVVAHVRDHREIAESMARREARDMQNNGIRCEVVQRTVTRGPWTKAS